MEKKMNFNDIIVGAKYMVKTVGGWRQATITEKSSPRKGMDSDYYIVKWKYAEPNMFGCVGGIWPSKDGMFNVKPLHTIYHVYDEITKNEYYVNCSEQQLNDIGILEWEGRYRYSLYDDNLKGTSVHGKKVLPFNSFKDLSNP